MIHVQNITDLLSTARVHPGHRQTKVEKHQIVFHPIQDGGN